ncbi:MAG: NAD(P)-dependent glycerol-3-phosphate dehydrogenase [bacterium]|nr:NAD(P)-dependent glycerol-3-phosphate dehydrogenase [bacterium]
MKQLGILGAGCWGTALAVHLSANGLDVTLWARRPELAEKLRRERCNHQYLPGIDFPPQLEVTAEMADVADREAVLVVVPSHGFREVVRELLARATAGRPKILISATKGIETETLARMSQVSFEEAVAADRDVRFAALGGPSFAAELAAGSPTVVVVASQDGELAAELRQSLATPSFRLYSTADVAGVELGGTTKNVIAIAAGVVSGLGLGQATLAALVTRGLHEITRLGLAYGGKSRTLAGLAGLGDLVLTCTGSLSHDLHLGLELAAGKTVREITDSTPKVAEGVRSSLAVAGLAKRRGVEMPITDQVVRILHHHKSPQRTVEDLMMRALRAETEL